MALALLTALALAAGIYALMRAHRRPPPRKVAMLGAAMVFLLIAGCSAVSIWAQENVDMSQGY